MDEDDVSKISGSLLVIHSSAASSFLRRWLLIQGKMVMVDRVGPRASDN